MDFQTKRAIDTLVGQLTDLQDRVDRAERAAGTSQLPHSALTGGAIRMVDADGTDRGSIGYQPDGTVAIVPSNGPPPPKPSTPGVSAAQLSLAIAWDGLFAEGDDGDPATQPKDFDHVQVHLSTTEGYTPDASTLQGSLSKPGSVVITPLSDENTYYAVLVPVNTSGIPGEASDPTAGTPDPVVSGEVLDGSITTLKLADDAVTAAKIAAAAVGTTEIADDAVTTPKVVAGAIQTAQLDAGAVNASKIAAGAVTTAKLDALAVTAANIAANAVTAGKINAGAVTAGTIAAGAVTASKLEATMVVATVMQSTGYVAGVSGWKIDGSGTVELNSAVARGTIDVGPTAAPYSRTHIDSKTISGESAGVISFPTSNTGETFPAEMYYSRAARTLIIEASSHAPNLNWAPQILLTDSDTRGNNTFQVSVGSNAEIYANSDTGAHLGNQVYDQTAFSGGANTPTSQSISGYGCTGQNHIGFASANTTVVGTVVLGVAVSSVTATSLIVWVCRTNTTSTTINYCIIGRT